eukprot:2479392-Rhodomonas_salina.1
MLRTALIAACVASASAFVPASGFAPMAMKSRTFSRLALIRGKSGGRRWGWGWMDGAALRDTHTLEFSKSFCRWKDATQMR